MNRSFNLEKGSILFIEHVRVLFNTLLSSLKQVNGQGFFSIKEEMDFRDHFVDKKNISQYSY